jgi:RHS repeat-associated protein
MTKAGVTKTYSYETGTNKVTAISGEANPTFDYDNVGNITQDHMVDLYMSYDYRNLPTLHFLWEGSAWLTYDASGLRVLKQLTGDLTDHYYVGDPEYNYLIKDYLGSVRLVLDENGDVQESYWYSPYGEVIDATVTGQSPAELKFTGHEEENEGLPGFYYAGARYYNSGVGIWYSTDPAGQTASPYLYAGNNPLIYTDPNGLWFGIDDLIISGVSFVVGYTTHGITTGDWGGDALAAGGIAAGSALLAYNTGGAAANLLFKEGSAGYALTASTVGGATGGATGSIGGQLYFNNGQVDWNQVGTSALTGVAGGLAGGVSGYYLTPDPVLTSMIGGAVGGGIEGSLHGQFFQGAFMGAYSGAMSGALTTVAYEEYGKYLTKKILGKDAYGRDYAGTPKGIKSQLAESGVEFIEDNYDCLSFAKDFHYTIGEGVGKPISYLQNRHFGVALGRTQYGQHMILSKLGSSYPIRVTTGRYLSIHFPYGGYRTTTWNNIVNTWYSGTKHFKF